MKLKRRMNISFVVFIGSLVLLALYIWTKPKMLINNYSLLPLTWKNIFSHRSLTRDFLLHLPKSLNKTYFENVILRALVPKLENNLYPERTSLFKTIMFNLIKSRHDPTLRSELDLMNLPNYEFDPGFRNPCWWENISSHSSYYSNVSTMKNKTGKTRVLRCLPYFYLIGQQKSGTSDLFYKIIQHPQVIGYKTKETEWLVRFRLLGKTWSSVDSYVTAFQPCTNIIWQKHKLGTINDYVTGEGTVGYFSHNDFWDLLPGNEDCVEPCVTNADLIHHITPNAKLILMMRDPTERLYSYYFHRNKHLEIISAEHFHALVVRDIEEFRNCLDSQTIRACCYDYKRSDQFTGELDLAGSIYYIFLADWLKVFPREQLHVMKYEEYATNGERQLQNLYRFLNLSDISDEELIKINRESPRREVRTKKGRAVGDMLETTRSLLEAFYKPFNEKLAVLLNDDKYLWLNI